jgi:AraC-like DNA-binding protein
MIKTSFQVKSGNPAQGVLFYWKMTLEADPSGPVSDRFIPELFYDYFCIQTGELGYVDRARGVETELPEQSLKTIHTRPLTLRFAAPLVLFGVRLSLQFAESFWEQGLPSNRFLGQSWVAPGTTDLASFARQIGETIRKRRASRTVAPMLSPGLEESEWLSHFSARHKRRLYKSIFGISKKEMRAIQGLHAFLGQACDFASGRPRIIEHIDAEVFYDQPHFNRLFRKMTELSPLEYLQAGSILQDNLMAASYNELGGQRDTMET